MLSMENAYRVGMVSKLTGLSAHTLRTWERRYGAVVPQRTDAGGRLYSDGDVQRLRMLRDLVSEGHAIGTVAALSDSDLARVTAAEHQTADPTPRPTEPSATDAFLEAVSQLDVGGAEAALSRAAVIAPPERFLSDVVAPALREVGNRWERGEFRIAHERVATGAARGLLFSLTRLYPPRERASVAVVAAPRGERHELGALMVAMLAAMRGFRVLYLGADVPENEIAYVARERSAQLVLLSVVNLAKVDVRQVARQCEKSVPRSARIILGGAAAVPVSGTRVEVLSDLAALDVVLRSHAA
ncbi:MAG: MerR family transcriptional regulator [Polyangiales bacterium]|nr:MerR family transcriptional regulator [Myxococcales bacterium]MCB9656834.1 MerR family transcriptional regulator [Sandaracinaceae bacterium]